MKTRVIIFALFLACFLLEMRNSLPTNRLKDFPSRQGVSRWNLPLVREAHTANLRIKQTPSNTEEMSGSNARIQHVTTLFHGMASRSTNPRKFLKEPKAQLGSNVEGADEGSVSKRMRRSSSQPQEGLASHPLPSKSLSVTSFTFLKPSSVTTEPTTATKPLKSSVIKSSPVSSDAKPTYTKITRSITSHTSIKPLPSLLVNFSNSRSASPVSLLPMSSAVTNRTRLTSSTLVLQRSSITILSTTRTTPLRSSSLMSSPTATHTLLVKPTQSSIAPLSPTRPTPQSSSVLIFSSADDSSNTSLPGQKRHKKKTPFPYWTIAVSGIGSIFVIIAAYLICKLRRQTQRGNDTQGPLPEHPQGMENPVYEGDEIPLPQLRIN